MPQPNYKQVAELIADRMPFKHGHSMRAEYNYLGIYCVYSYATLIATYDTVSRKWWINENKYSVTTSKQQNIIRRAASEQGWEAPLSV
jgi:hypothetical protein